MTVRIFPELEQGSEEWFAARCGLLTASEMKLIVTPATLKAASNDKERAHMFELLAQRITQYVEPRYVGDDQLRGHEDEIEARRLYAERYEAVTEVGFVTNDRFGFVIGYSPDGLIGQHGQLECKSRRQRFHVQHLVEDVCGNTIPAEFLIQVQTGLLVSERQWCDLTLYCGGMHMAVIRAHPDPKVHEAILNAAGAFEKRIEERLQQYRSALVAEGTRLVPTERKVEEEMYV